MSPIPIQLVQEIINTSLDMTHQSLNQGFSSYLDTYCKNEILITSKGALHELSQMEVNL